MRGSSEDLRADKTMKKEGQRRSSCGRERIGRVKLSARALREPLTRCRTEVAGAVFPLGKQDQRRTLGGRRGRDPEQRGGNGAGSGRLQLQRLASLQKGRSTLRTLVTNKTELQTDGRRTDPSRIGCSIAPTRSPRL